MQPNFLLQSEVPHMQDWLYGLIIVYWAHGINYFITTHKAMLKYFFFLNEVIAQQLVSPLEEPLQTLQYFSVHSNFHIIIRMYLLVVELSWSLSASA